MMRSAHGLVAFALTLVAGSAAAYAGQHGYAGGHPRSEGGYCYIEAPHVHVYGPSKKHKVLYREHDDHKVFMGDPVAYGYDGPRHSYYGHHPVHVDVAVGMPAPEHHVEYCYLNGPHYHSYIPDPALKFEVKGDAYWYVGPLHPIYAKHKKQYVPVNTVYAEIDYARPVITVEPPAAYVALYGPVVHGGVGVGVGGGAAVGVGAGVGVSAGVHVNMPSVEFGIGVPGVVVVEEHHHHVKHKKYKKHKKHRSYRRTPAHGKRRHLYRR